MLPSELMREDEKVAPDGVIAQEKRYIRDGKLVVAYESASVVRFFGIGHYAVVVNTLANRCDATALGLNPDVDAGMSARIQSQTAKLIQNQTFPIADVQNVREAFERYEAAFREYASRIGELQTQTFRTMSERALAARMADARGGKLVVQ